MNLELAILSVLRNAGKDLLVLRSVLVANLRAIHDRKESLAEIDSAIQSLEGSGQAIGVFNKDTGHKYKITDSGFVRLAEAGV